MEKQGLTESSHNIIPFPNLPNRLLEKGVQALREKHYKKALKLFEQLNQLEPDNSQAAYGLAVCYVELENYGKAEELTEQMMKQGIGDYFDVLKLHITILIQQHHYEKVVSTIQVVLSETSPPPEVRESLLHLTEFAQIRMQEEPPELHDVPLKPSFSPNVKEELNSQKTDVQWKGIQKARQFLTDDVQEHLLDYLLSDHGDPFLKSIVIQILNDNGYAGNIRVNKFGQIFDADLKETHLFYEGFSKLVQNLLETTLESSNPTLLETARHIWHYFTITFYPKPLDPNLPNVWAAGCCVLAHQIQGIEVNYQKLQLEFDVTKEQLARPLSLLKSIEENRLSIDEGF